MLEAAHRHLVPLFIFSTEKQDTLPWRLSVLLLSSGDNVLPLLCFVTTQS